MKSKFYQGLIALTLFTALMLPAAQAEPRIALEASIPFEFVVQEKHLPSGEYQVKLDHVTGLVLIQSRNGHSAAFTTTIPVQTQNSLDVGELVFNRYDDQYFLSRIVTPRSDTGRQVLKSRLERDLARNMADPGTTVVAAHSSKK